MLFSAPLQAAKETVARSPIHNDQRMTASFEIRVAKLSWFHWQTVGRGRISSHAKRK
jgi:hypothetical protein